MYCRFHFVLILLLAIATARADEAIPVSAGNSGLTLLVRVLKRSDDPAYQLDVLKGMNEALKGRRGVAMPNDWPEVYAKLSKSPNADVRALAQTVATAFGDAASLDAMRKSLMDTKAELGARTNALESLVSARDKETAPLLQQLLSDDALRQPALRGLAAFDDPQTPTAVLAVFASLNSAEKHDALSTLVSRVAYARPLLAAVGQGTVKRPDLSADIVRNLRNLKNEEISALVAKVWGVVQESDADKKALIAKYKAIVLDKDAKPGDAAKGRTLFAKTCQQCHTLFGEGGKVGPDITGSNRADLDYILENVVDPNAVIPNDYRAWVIEMKDGRIITGIVTKQDDNAVTVNIPNESPILSRPDIAKMRQSEISMMPEELLAPLGPDDVRDLISYLRSHNQVPLSTDTAKGK